MRLLKFREVADILNCSLSNVYALAEAGVLPVHRIGLKQGKRVSDHDLDIYMGRVRSEGALPTYTPPKKRKLRLVHLKLKPANGRK